MRVLDGSLFGPGQPCFGCAPDHPFGLRLKFTEEGEEVVTRFTPAAHHQGAPGVMHGGLVFTLADELAAWVVIARLGKFGFTTHFTGKLQRPARPGLELVGRARMTASTGRTASVDADVQQGEEKIFAASFKFVLLDEHGAEKMLGQPLPPEWRRFLR